jgi:hypothetical protein
VTQLWPGVARTRTDDGAPPRRWSSTYGSRRGFIRKTGSSDSAEVRGHAKSRPKKPVVTRTEVDRGRTSSARTSPSA